VSGPRVGAIHDIGYRHYDGPRLGLGAIRQSLAVHSLRGNFGLGRTARSKVMPILLLVIMLLPALVIAAIVALTNADTLQVRYPAYAINLQVVVTIFLAAQSPQSVSRDLRFNVISLYFSRPLTRRAYVDAKLVAMSAALLVLMVLPLLMLFGGAMLAGMPLWTNVRGLGEGVVGAAVLSIVLASLGLTVAAFTPRRGIGVAAIVATLLILAAVTGIVQGIARGQGSRAGAGWAGLMSPYSLVDGVQVWLFGTPSATVAGPPGHLGGPVFALATVALVAGCYALLLVRYRRVTVS
jgi:ABC-2 type transport system permease protein